MTQLVELAIAFGHPLSGGQMGIMPAVFNAHWRTFKELWPTAEYVDEQPFSGWTWLEKGPEEAVETLNERGYLELSGPCGFSARVGRRFAVIRHSTTWSDFVLDELTRYIMCETARLFARIFQSSEWLYVPECDLPPSIVIDWVSRDLSLNQVIVQLKPLCGEPAVCFPVFTEEEQALDPNFYFIEKA